MSDRHERMIARARSLAEHAGALIDGVAALCELAGEDGYLIREDLESAQYSLAAAMERLEHASTYGGDDE